MTDELFEDEFGRLCVTTSTALALADEHREQKAKQAEAAAQRAAEKKRRPVPAGGVPAEAGLSAYDAMMAACGPERLEWDIDDGPFGPRVSIAETCFQEAALEQAALAKERAIRRMKKDLR